ncbi:MAG: YlxR family protein [Candidatus Electrothrix sp. YB6]
MKRRHVPVRTCRGCGRKAAKNELIRLVWYKGALHEDTDSRMPGRGAYCCRDGQCRNRLKKKKKMLGRIFRLHG